MSSLGMGRHAGLSTRNAQWGTLYFVALLREELGRRIRVARKGAKLTQQELAEKIGLKHAQDVSRYERGKIEVPSARIDLIAEATGRPRSFFVRDPSEQPLEPSEIAELRDEVRALRQSYVELVQRIDRLLAEHDPRRPGTLYRPEGFGEARADRTTSES